MHFFQNPAAVRESGKPERRMANVQAFGLLGDMKETAVDFVQAFGAVFA